MLGNLAAEIVTTDDSTRWQQVLDEIGEYDYHHLPGIHRLAENKSEVRAVMPVFREDRYTIAFPMLIRDINLHPDCCYSNLKDITSVNGFAGPVASTKDIPQSTKQHFFQFLCNFFENNNVITAYARFNPLINNSSIMDGYGEIVDIGPTLSIDLTLSQKEQIARYRKSLRYQLNLLRRLGFTCKKVGTEYLDDFIRLYYDTMTRVDARREFFYEKSYFENMLTDIGVMHLFACSLDGVITAVGTCTLCGGILQNNFTGTDINYRKYAPTTLLNDTMRAWGCEMGAKIFHLGGGVGAKRDSLFDFKLGFGCKEHTYSTWRCIVNKEIYDDLWEKMSRQAGIEIDSSYFPAYRNPDLHK